MKLIRSYYLLCKPNVVYMMLICALVGMLLAEDSVSSISTIIIALLGIALCSGSAAAINQVIDRNADALVATRDTQRPEARSRAVRPRFDGRRMDAIGVVSGRVEGGF